MQRFWVRMAAAALSFVSLAAISDYPARAADRFVDVSSPSLHRVFVPVSQSVTLQVNATLGDIVVGDEDGVVSFPAAGAAALLEAVRVQIKREDDTLKAIREGRYQGSYGKS